MSDRVHADIEGLRRLRKEIETSQQTINEAMGRLRSALANAQWDDAARRTFETQLQETFGSLRKFEAQAEALKPVLARKIEALTAFLQQ